MKRQERIEQMIGLKFHKLTVISFSHRGPNRLYYWNCVCECGGKNVVSTSTLRFGATKSCGCLSRKIKHGLYKHPLYTVWHDMITRCSYVSHRSYSSYGGRGINVCETWRKYNTQFFDWCFLNGWAKGLQLDRIDPNGDYYPENCRFITPKQNANNKRGTYRVEYNGYNRTLSEWSEATGIPIHLIRDRFYNKMPPEMILSPTKLKRNVKRKDIAR